MRREAVAEVVATVRDYIRYLQRLGVTELPLAFSSSPPSVAHTAGEAPGVMAAPTVSAATTRHGQLAQLAARVRDCRKCPLHTGRTQVVFGTGNADADLVFIGEAPGQDEDRQGEPFVGRAGQLLTRIIEAIGLSRDQVYILNVIKCRPPHNRDPLPDEVAACRVILDEQLTYLQPRVICALGTFAAQALLRTEESISRLRGRFHLLGDIRVMPTYHPAYLLRHPQGKRAVWEDMQHIQRVLGLP